MRGGEGRGGDVHNGFLVVPRSSTVYEYALLHTYLCVWGGGGGVTRGSLAAVVILSTRARDRSQVPQ